MTGLLERPTAGRHRPAPEPSTPGTEPDVATGRRFDDLLVLPVLLLLLAASLSLARVFQGWGFAAPVGGALVVALGLSWGTRRLGAGPVLSLGANVLGWLAFVAAAFLPASTLAGVVPTPASLSGMAQLWTQAVELIAQTPAPVPPAPAVVALTVTGVWAVAHVVDALAFRLRAPVKAVSVALVLWAVPLALAEDPARSWPGAVAFLAAGALVLLAFAGAGLRRWGVWVHSPPARRPGSAGGARRGPSPLTSLGVALAAVAIVAGSAVAGVLPGFGEQPWYEVGGAGGSTAYARNPLVDIRADLVDLDDTPQLRVETERREYLRLTSLDTYEDGRWTAGTISAAAVTPGERLEPERRMGSHRTVDFDVEVRGLSQALLVPAPYQPAEVTDTDAALRYDPNRSTLTTSESDPLDEGERYSVRAEIPEPRRDELTDPRDAPARIDERYTELPVSIPAQVENTAERIVDDADATTAAEQALAIQNHLRGWDYSTEPAAGHHPDAMLNFLETQQGYCEQFAGTMAVMLRTLDIPARVAVGFTPGQRVDGEDGVYEVTNANAHAWVEVLFPDSGWIRFEPTPRDNVLVPSAANLAPTQLRGQGGQDETPEPDTEPPAPESSPPEAQQQAQPEPDPAGGGDDSSGVGWLAAAALVVVAGAAGGLALWRWRAGERPHTPAERVARAHAEVERVGRGLGVPPGPSETEREYLGRLAGSVAAANSGGAGGDGDASALAALTARARYAPELDAAEAAEAEKHAARLCDALLGGQSSFRRRWVLLRADAATAADAFAASVRRARLRA